MSASALCVGHQQLSVPSLPYLSSKHVELEAICFILSFGCTQQQQQQLKDNHYHTMSNTMLGAS